MSAQYKEALAYLEREARRFAEMYAHGSDGRNTFVIFADKIAAQASSLDDPLADDSHAARLEAALEWALDHAGADHPHYPERELPRTAYRAWRYPYLMSGPVGAGVGHAGYPTALEAVEAARAEKRA